MTSPARLAGATVLGLIALGALVAPLLAIHPPARQFPDFVHAPPMPVRIADATGRLRAPFVYALRLEDRLERRYSEDRSRPIPLRFFQRGPLVSVDIPDAFWFPLGTDSLGRDVFSRLVLGSRLSLGVAALAAAAALLIGALAGALAGYAGGRLDDLVMRTSDLVLALPAIYVVLTLRAAMPLVLSPAQVFWTMTAVLAMVGWPWAARGVRAVVATERTREYAEAARAAGASGTRLLLRHLLPATWGQLGVHATLLLPAFILAEATLSFVGLGFGEPTSSWGLMLQEAGRGRALAEAPWLLLPAAAIVTVALGVNLLGSSFNVREAAAHRAS